MTGCLHVPIRYHLTFVCLVHSVRNTGSVIVHVSFSFFSKKTGLFQTWVISNGKGRMDLGGESKSLEGGTKEGK